MEDILAKIMKLEGKIENKKYTKVINANETIVIEVSKGPTKNIIRDLQDNRFEHWDELGQELITFSISYTDATAKNKFLEAEESFFVYIVNDRNSKDRPMYYTARTYGEWKDELGDEHEVVLNKDIETEDLNKAIQFLEDCINDFDETYIPKQARSKLESVMENCMV